MSECNCSMGDFHFASCASASDPAMLTANRAHLQSLIDSSWNQALEFAAIVCETLIEGTETVTAGDERNAIVRGIALRLAALFRAEQRAKPS